MSTAREDLETAIRAANPGFRIEVSDKMQVTVHEPNSPGVRGSVLDLSAIAGRTRVVLTLGRAVTISSLQREASVDLDFDRDPFSGSFELGVEPTVLGTIHLQGARDLSIIYAGTDEEDDGPQFVVCSSSITMQDRRATSHMVVLPDDADMPPTRLSGHVGSVTLEGDRLVLLEGTTVETLIVRHPDATLEVKGRAEIYTVVGRKSSRLHRLTLRPFGGPADLDASPPIIEINELAYLRLSGQAAATIDMVLNARVEGQGLEIRLVGQAAEVEFHGAVLALTNGNAVAAGITGLVELSHLSGGTVVGDPKEGFLLLKVTPRKGRNDQPLEHALLENVKIPSGVAGLQALGHMQHLRGIEPHTRTDLAGWSLRREMRTLPPLDRHERLDLSYNATLMRRYAELVREKGASGSASTKVSWCAQRLRHQTTTGKWEQIALWGYRLLGYGERPGPPFLTWVVASVMLTGVLAAHRGPQFDGEGVGNFLNLFFSEAVSPIGSIVRTGATASDDAWVYLVRAVVAVPLIVGVLALRKYTRAGGPE